MTYVLIVYTNTLLSKRVTAFQVLLYSFLLQHSFYPENNDKVLDSKRIYICENNSAVFLIFFIENKTIYSDFELPK